MKKVKEWLVEMSKYRQVARDALILINKNTSEEIKKQNKRLRRRLDQQTRELQKLKLEKLESRH